jgi:archaellum component FlaD/FlaE
MKLDPDNYDPDELRRLAETRTHDSRRRDERENGEFSFGNVVDRRRRGGADSLRSSQLEHLFLYQSATDDLHKPYLRSLPEKYAAERVVFDWLEFLVLKGGFKRALEALRYYRTIGWVTADVASDLEDYLLGFEDDGDGGTSLDIDDHQLSLVYLARLASMTE